MSHDSSRRFERFVTWYLRFNGYFTVPNFVVHAGDDPGQISGVVRNRTEVDTLAVRLPYSREMSGTEFLTHPTLVNGAEGRFDVVIAEVKSGESNSPNPTWQQPDRVSDVEYLLRFIGWHRDETEIQKAAKQLQANYTFEDADVRLRYIIFSQKENRAWSDRHVKYITFEDCIQFISEKRGQSWAQSGIGLRSMHDQWDPLINDVFKIANGPDLDPRSRNERIWAILNGD